MVVVVDVLEIVAVVVEEEEEGVVREMGSR